MSADEPRQMLPCRECGGATEYATLSALGGQCSHCYHAWRRRRPEHTPPAVPADAIPERAGMRRWAYALRWREQAGHDLTDAQRAAWRSVLPTRQATIEDTTQ